MAEMNDSLRWSFWTYPKALFASLAIGALPVIAILQKLLTSSPVEQSQIVAAGLFLGLGIFLSLLKTEIVIQRKPFLFLISRNFPRKDLAKVHDARDVSVEFRPHLNSISFSSRDHSRWIEVYKAGFLLNTRASKKYLELRETLGPSLSLQTKEENAVLNLRSKTPWMTISLIALNLVIMIAAYFEPSSIKNFSLNRNAFSEGRYWLLLSYFFVHAGFFHLGMNMLALYDLGQKIESGFGVKKFLSIYFAAGIFAGAYSLLFLGEGVLVGASGAIFGLMGTAFYFSRSKQNAHILGPISKFDLISCIAISLIPGVSFAAHFGGFVAGYVFGWLFKDSLA